MTKAKPKPNAATKRLQTALNHFAAQYQLASLHVTVDGLYGATTDHASRAAQLILGIKSNDIGTVAFDKVVNWLTSPAKLYAVNPLAYARHRNELAKWRAPKHSAITTFDGKKMAGWIADILQAARNDGVQFAVTSGYRTYAEQAYLVAHPQGYPVAAPGQSHHNGFVFPDGAADVGSGQQALSDWLDAHPKIARGLTWARSKDAVHFSIPGQHHPNEGSY